MLRKYLRSSFLYSASFFKKFSSQGSISLIYCHDVNKIDADNFRHILLTLLSSGYEFIDSTRLIDIFNGLSDFPNTPCVHLSFDDALLGVYESAFPILKELSIPSTIFVPTGLIGAPISIQNASLVKTLKSPNSKFCSWDQLDEMVSGGVILGSHTSWHFSLSYLEENGFYNQIINELQDSYQRLLEYKFKYHLLAWPFGSKSHINDAVKNMIFDTGYDAIFSGIRGPIFSPNDFCFSSIPRNHFEANWPIQHIKFFIGENRFFKPLF